MLTSFKREKNYYTGISFNNKPTHETSKQEVLQ